MNNPTWIASVVSILSIVLPLLGVQVGSAELTTTFQTIFVVLSGIVVIAHGVQNGHFTVFGSTK